MDSFDKSFTKAIISKLSARLNRDLSKAENKAFTRPRSGIAYEMIMDYISDIESSSEEIELYVAGVVKENEG